MVSSGSVFFWSSMGFGICILLEISVSLEFSGVLWSSLFLRVLYSSGDLWFSGVLECSAVVQNVKIPVQLVLYRTTSYRLNYKRWNSAILQYGTGLWYGTEPAKWAFRDFVPQWYGTEPRKMAFQDYVPQWYGTEPSKVLFGNCVPRWHGTEPPKMAVWDLCTVPPWYGTQIPKKVFPN